MSHQLWGFRGLLAATGTLCCGLGALPKPPGLCDVCMCIVGVGVPAHCLEGTRGGLEGSGQRGCSAWVPSALPPVLRTTVHCHRFRQSLGFRVRDSDKTKSLVTKGPACCLSPRCPALQSWPQTSRSMSGQACPGSAEGVVHRQSITREDPTHPPRRVQTCPGPQPPAPAACPVPGCVSCPGQPSGCPLGPGASGFSFLPAELPDQQKEGTARGHLTTHVHLPGGLLPSFGPCGPILFGHLS